MNAVKKHVWTLGAILTVALLLAAMLISGPFTSNAAPLGAPTPVYTGGLPSSATSRLAVFNSGTPVAMLTPVTNCFTSAGYSTGDFTTISTQAAALTITLQWGNDLSNLFTNQAILAANATPVSAGQQYGLFGQQTCIKLQSANATPVSVYSKATFK